MANRAAPPHLHTPLSVLLGTRAKVGLLRLLSAEGEALSQRELARRAGLTLRSAQQALSELYALGVVTRMAGGRDHLSVFNSAHVLAQPLAALFIAEGSMARQLRIAVVTAATGNNDAPLGLYLFGSVARAQETLASDVDVLLIARSHAHRDALLDRVLDATASFHTAFGVRVAPLAFTIRDAKRGWAAGTAPWSDISQDATSLLGPPLAELLK